MTDRRIPPAGDPYHAAKLRELAELEERHAHELMADEERELLRDRIVRLRRRLGVASA